MDFPPWLVPPRSDEEEKDRRKRERERKKRRRYTTCGMVYYV
jgi:hypothetical protein